MTPLISIRRREQTLKIQDRELNICFEEKRVSQWSYFVDLVWILSEKKSIHWQSLAGNTPEVDRANFDSLMLQVRRLAYLILVEEEASAATIYNIVQFLKRFVCWMLSQSIPIRRFSDVTSSDIKRYLEHLSQRPATVRVHRRVTGTNERVAPCTVRRHALVLLRLYHYRHRIGDGLNDFRALLDDSTYYVQSGESKTDPIPDQNFQDLLSAAIRFVDENAVEAIRELRKFIVRQDVLEVHEALSKMLNDDLSGRRQAKVAARIRLVLLPTKRELGRTRTIVPLLSPGTIARMTNTTIGEASKCLRENRQLRSLYARRKVGRGESVHWDCDDRNTKIRMLQIACFIILATSTGMRFGELLAIKPGCLLRRKTRGVPLYWVKSILSKTSINKRGEPAAWLCGELAAKAVTILEELYTVLPTTTVTKTRVNISKPDSLFRTYVWDAVTLEAHPIYERAIVQKSINLFIETMGLTVGYIHPHQFRRSFARNIVRWTNTPILALQRHFKHWSLLMTDYYIGADSQLMEMFYQEQLEASQARLRQILSGECGGPGGIILQKRLAKMTDLGELPKSFRGRKRETPIESLIDQMSRDGVLAYKCADFTTCLYVPGVAKCGEDGPKEHECHPTECENSHILLEDVPFYLRNISQNRKVYQQLTSAEQRGPFGLFVLKRIRNDVAAIKPLARLYYQKLIVLQKQPGTVNNTDRTFSQTAELRNRISEEMQVLESVLAEIDAQKKQKGKGASRLEAKASGAHA